MSGVIGARTWILWWAAVTATAFLRIWVRATAAFFREGGFFAPERLPFSLAGGLSAWLQSGVTYLIDSVKFKPTETFVQVGGLIVPNYALAFLLGIVLLAGAIAIYLRALGTERWADDLLALLLLYFVLRIEAHLLQISKLGTIADFGRLLLGSPALLFGLVVAVLIAGLLLDSRIRNARAIWRAVGEALLLAILIFPQQAAAWLAGVLDALAQFGDVLQANLGLALVWGITGLLLAAKRLYRNDLLERSV